MPDKVDKYTHYRKDGDGRWWFLDGRGVSKDLPSAFYTIGQDPYSGEPFLSPRTSQSDQIVPIPNPHAERTLEIAKDFMAGVYAEPFKQLGLINKMAMLLWGEPGTSKSVTLSQIVDFANENGWITLDGSAAVPLVSNVIGRLRMVEPDKGVVVIWEEFDRLIDGYEHEILQLLDGAVQLPNVLYVMTTNYINRIPKRVFTRCRRIPFQVQFDFPGPEERRAYFAHKIPVQWQGQVNIEEWVNKTQGLSIDHCAQVLVGVFALGQSLDDVLKDLQERMSIYGDGFRMEPELQSLLTDGDAHMPPYMIKKRAPGEGRITTKAQLMAYASDRGRLIDADDHNSRTASVHKSLAPLEKLNMVMARIEEAARRNHRHRTRTASEGHGGIPLIF